MSLFQPLEPEASASGTSRAAQPLAERMRPRTLDEFIGQEKLLGSGKPLRTQIERDELSSMVLWGPPGCGKTTLAHIIAKMTRSEFLPFSAVLAGIKEIKQVMSDAQRSHRAGRRTIIFVDEVHRFNKAQQDAFLPHVEAGTIVLIGATTENPSFEVIAPLLSRTKVYLLEPLSTDQLSALLRRAVEHPVRDLRPATNPPEAAVHGARRDPGARRIVTLQLVEEVLQRKLLRYDKAGEEHYNLISALHKSVRNSDPDAALYWLARMLESGEDPLYIARRLVRMASEDIGLAEPGALAITVAAKEAVEFVGMPEGNLALAQGALYLALAPKSNALYTAYSDVQKDLQATVTAPLPLHLCNAVTGLMPHIGYGEGYQYAHD